MDDLSKQLKSCNARLIVGSTVVNHMMYADELFVVSPCSADLQELPNVRSVLCLTVCNKFKYLGHFITKMTDNVAQANILKSKFGACKNKVKRCVCR